MRPSRVEICRRDDGRDAPGKIERRGSRRDPIGPSSIIPPSPRSRNPPQRPPPPGACDLQVSLQIVDLGLVLDLGLSLCFWLLAVLGHFFLKIIFWVSDLGK